MKPFLFNPFLFFLSSIRLCHGYRYPLSSGIPKWSVVESMRNIHAAIRPTSLPVPYPSFQSRLYSTKRRKEDNTQVKSTFQPKTKNQRDFLQLMRDTEVDIVIAIGPAGTGKTMLACYSAVEALRGGKIHKIVITRPVVSVDEELGFLPGGLESKMDPWTRPVFDVLRESYTAKDIERMTEEGIIEIVPLGFMRGRTFKHTWIIADEMQNSSPTQMLMLATRIGDGSKMVITGDLNQSDRDIYDNGLREIYEKVRDPRNAFAMDCVKYIELEKDDVQRSRAAKRILDIYSEPRIHDDVMPDTGEEDGDGEEELMNESVYGYHEFSNEPEPVAKLSSAELSSAKLSSAELSKSQAHNGHSGHADKEWIQLTKDDDAALIPLHHVNQLKGKMI